MGRCAPVPDSFNRPAAVYLLHFADGSHYIGTTSAGVDRRLRRHISGYGSIWVYRKVLQVGPPTVGAVEWWPSMISALTAERKHKRYRREFYAKCSVCGGKADG